MTKTINVYQREDRMSKQIKRKFKINKFLSLILIISAVYLIYNILLLDQSKNDKIFNNRNYYINRFTNNT